METNEMLQAIADYGDPLQKTKAKLLMSGDLTIDQIPNDKFMESVFEGDFSKAMIRSNTMNRKALLSLKGAENYCISWVKNGNIYSKVVQARKKQTAIDFIKARFKVTIEHIQADESIRDPEYILEGN